MVGVIRRMHALREILKLRHGPGAAVLPPTISRIHLEFSAKNAGGHMGPRKFWQENLPRLKYWNPKVPMIVNRKPESHGTATLTLYFREGKMTGTPSQSNSSTQGLSKAPEPAEGEKAEVVDVKGLHSTEILDVLMRKTNAAPVQPTPEEEAEMKDIEDLRRRGEVDRQRNRRDLEATRKEKARLAAAMSEAAAIKAAAQ